MALTLHRLARAYGVDPYTIHQEWTPEQVSFNVRCLHAASAATSEACRRTKPMAVVEVGDV